MPDDSKNFGFCHLKWCFLLFVLHVPVCTAFDEQLDNFYLTLLAGQVQWSVLKVQAHFLGHFVIFLPCRPLAIVTVLFSVGWNYLLSKVPICVVFKDIIPNITGLTIWKGIKTLLSRKMSEWCTFLFAIGQMWVIICLSWG